MLRYQLRSTAREPSFFGLRDLKPSTFYLVQHAFDSVDGVYTGGTTNPAEWATVDGAKEESLITGSRGTFPGSLYRTLPRRLVGTAVNMHDCFHFKVNR